MSEIIRITKGQPFALYVPLVQLNADGTKEGVDTALLTDTVVIIKGNAAKQVVTPQTHEHYLVLQLTADLQTAEYALFITATLPTGRPFSLRIKRAFAVVEWDFESNWRDYLVGDHVELNDQLLIAGYFNTDAEIETLKQQYRQRITEAAAARTQYETSKAALDALAEDLTDIAQETQATANKQAILTAIDNIDLSSVEDKVDAVQTAVENIDFSPVEDKVDDVKTAVENIDFSALAKQGTNTDATNTAILSEFANRGVFDLSTTTDGTAAAETIANELLNDNNSNEE